MKIHFYLLLASIPLFSSAIVAQTPLDSRRAKANVGLRRAAEAVAAEENAQNERDANRALFFQQLRELAESRKQRTRFSPFLQLNNLVETRLQTAGDQPSITILRPKYRLELQHKTKVQTRVEERRIRVVETVDGEDKIVEQVFPEAIDEELDETDVALVRDGVQLDEINLDQIRFFDLDGEVVTGEELKSRLAEFTPVFFNSGSPDRHAIDTVRGFQRRMLTPQTLIAFTLKEFSDVFTSNIAPQQLRGASKASPPMCP